MAESVRRAYPRLSPELRAKFPDGTEEVRDACARGVNWRVVSYDGHARCRGCGFVSDIRGTNERVEDMTCGFCGAELEPCLSIGLTWEEVRPAAEVCLARFQPWDPDSPEETWPKEHPAKEISP